MTEPERLRLRQPAASDRAAEAEARCRRALELMLTRRGNPRREVERALAEDPRCIFAHCLRLALIVRANDREAWRTLTASIVAIEALCADPRGIAARHAAAASAWAEGDGELAMALYSTIAVNGPRDDVALAVAHALRLRLERPQKGRAPLPLVFPEWSALTPGHAGVLAMYAFGLQLDGQHRRAEKTAHRALILEPGRRRALLVLADVAETRASMRERATDAIGACVGSLKALPRVCANDEPASPRSAA